MFQYTVDNCIFNIIFVIQMIQKNLNLNYFYK